MSGRNHSSAQTYLRQRAESFSAALPALKAAAERAVFHIIHGDHNLRRPGTGERFWQFRDYDESDRPQDIDWRQSGKTDQVFIRQREKQNSQSVFFWTARDSGMAFQSDTALTSKREAAQILTLALAILLGRAGEQIGRFGSFKTGRSDHAIDRIGSYICTDHQDAIAANPAQFKPPQNAYLIQIGDFLSPLEDIEARFEHLSARSHNGCIVQVLDPAELDLPYDGRVLFEDSRGDTPVPVDNVASVRAAYHARITAHGEALQELALHQGWSFVRHRCDRPIEETLGEIWQIIAFHLQNDGNGGAHVY